MKMPVACVGRASRALHPEVPGALDRKIQIIPGASDHPLRRVDLSVTHLTERICSLIQCRHSAVPTSFGQNRPKDVLFTAKAGAAAVRYVGGDGVERLGPRH